MIRHLVDHCFDEDFLQAARRRAERERLTMHAELARDVGLARAKDDELLAWAAENERVVLTHDRNTLAGRAHARTRAGLRMPGVVVVDDQASESLVAEDLLIITFATRHDEWQGQVHYVPL